MSAKPPPFIAPKKAPEPLTWETFHRSRPVHQFAECLSPCLMRIRYRVATTVLIRLINAGCSVRIDDGKLLIRPGEKIIEDDRRLIVMLRDEIINLVQEGIIDEQR